MNSACLAHDDVCNFKVGEEREELRMANVAKENEQPGGVCLDAITNSQRNV